MVEFTTESGAIYQIPEDLSGFRRVGPVSPGINYEAHPDSDWHEIVNFEFGGLDHPLLFTYPNGSYRRTTRVVDVREIDD